MHLLSESSKWITVSEFVDKAGNISLVKGETNIILINDIEIVNDSWAEFNNNKIENNYQIKKIQLNLYSFESKNPSLGVQKGTFNIDRDTIFSKFIIENTELNGFEVIIRNNDNCFAYGALYDKNNLINTWTATMNKVCQ